MESIQKFQDLLKRLFQFETSNLDFGIYRILNYKRDRIEKFIQEDLKNKVEGGFAKHKDERLTNINQRFEEAKQKVIQGLGTQALTPAGELKEDKELIIKELEPWAPHIVYVNGQSVLTPKLGKHNVKLRYIEPEFKKLMEV